MSAAFTYTVTEDNSKAVTALVRAALKRGLLQAGEHILTKSNAVVPLEEGDLARSGAVTEASMADLTVAVSYDTPYAVIQHEDMSLKHDPGRTAKFLALACKAEAVTAGRIVATAVKRVTG